jgi:hypothetical protein
MRSPGGKEGVVGMEKRVRVDPEKAVKLILDATDIVYMDAPVNASYANVVIIDELVRIEFVGPEYSQCGGPACILFVIILRKTERVRALLRALGVEA